MLCRWISWIMIAAALLPGGISLAQVRYGNGYLHPESKEIHLDGERLGRCFFAEARRHAVISIPNIYEKYPELESYLQGDKGYSYSTGLEQELRRIILLQPAGSVDPYKIFVWSLQLHEGRLFQALLAIHQLLRNEARFYRDWVNYPSSYELMRHFFNQFVDIRGDLEERGQGFHGDHRGSWYRIWGTMMDSLGFMMPSKESSGTAIEVLGAASNLTLASIYGVFRAQAAEWVKPIIMYGAHDESDPRKAEVNLWGYATIEGMVLASRDPSWSEESWETYRKICHKPEVYLR